MTDKNLNLKVTSEIFYHFHMLKGNLKAGTNQDCLHKLLLIADQKIKTFTSIQQKNQFIKSINTQLEKITS